MKLQKQTQGMVDISQKTPTKRTATASATLKFSKSAFKILITKGSPKGDVFETAKVAGIMAAKATPRIIPMCHPLALNKVSIDFKIDKKKSSLRILSEVSCFGRTGVEMEALTATSVAALTVYDMMKWADKAITISAVKLLSKSGGKSGDFKRPS